jgi:hypothetical protein
MEFNFTRNQILQKACRLAGVTDEGEMPNSDLLASAADSLNIILKDMEVFNFRLWSEDRITINIKPSDRVRVYNPDTSKYEGFYCIKTHRSNNDSKPLTGKFADEYWYSDNKGIDATTFNNWYANKDYINGGEAEVPSDVLSIEGATVRKDNVDYPVKIINRFSEADIQSKWEEGTPVRLKYDKANKIVRFYYLPDDNYNVTLLVIKSLPSVEHSGDIPDVPGIFLSYLILETAAWIAEEYSNFEKVDRLRALAQAKLALASRQQKEFESSSFIEPIY